MADTPLAAAGAALLPATTPTILSSAVATALNATPQSPLLVQGVQKLALAVQPPIVYQPPSRLPWILSGAGMLGLGIAGFFLLRKKGRK